METIFSHSHISTSDVRAHEVYYSSTFKPQTPCFGTKYAKIVKQKFATGCRSYHGVKTNICVSNSQLLRLHVGVALGFLRWRRFGGGCLFRSWCCFRCLLVAPRSFRFVTLQLHIDHLQVGFIDGDVVCGQQLILDVRVTGPAAVLQFLLSITHKHKRDNKHCHRWSRSPLISLTTSTNNTN